MGYQAPITFEDPGAEMWVGEHRPELIDLEHIFRRVVTLDVSVLEVGMSSASEAWRAALPEDVHIIQILSPHAVHVHMPRGAVVKDFVIKVSLPGPDRGWRRLTARVERSRSHRAHLWAHRLRAIGIDTPRPLGFVERGKTPGRFVSFAVSEYVLAPTLIELRDQRLAALGAGPRGAMLHEKRALIERVAAVFRAMHAHRLFHGDLHPGNLLVSDRDVLVIDLESMRRFALPERAALRALVKLNRAFLDTRAITRTDRMRFLRAYLRHSADRAGTTRALWSKVLLGTEMKLDQMGQAFR